MEFTKILGPRMVAVVVALVVATLAYLDVQATGGGTTALANQEPTTDRSVQASEAEADIARTNLAGRMTTALGESFGGVWFEPATAQLHVGVTSEAGARLVEGVAADVGLSEIVTATPVASTWAQLEAAQGHWDDRVGDLLGRGEARTAIFAGANSIEVDLGPTVSAARRGELSRVAATAGTEVAIEFRSEPISSGGKGAQCAKWEKYNAFCDPTIVAGVSLDGEEDFEGNRTTCSTGPTAILVNRDQKEAATKTYILTAGHCIEDNGGEGENWYAYDKKGVAGGENLLGTGGPFLNEKTDVGAILIDKSKNYWVKDKEPIPITPKVALWDGTKEHEPTVVKKQIPPVENAKTCFSGERSGKVCGTIEKPSVSFKFPGEPVATERLAEVKLGGGKQGGKGDSGGPFYSEATPSSLEGTMVGYSGGEPETGEGPIVYFQPLGDSFETLAKETAFTLELLTETNQKRHGKFKAAKYPVTIHGSTTAVHKFTTADGHSVECKENTYHAVLSAESSTLTVTPTYLKCTASFGVAATVEMEGCTYVLHVSEKLSADNYRAHADISCPAGKSIKISAPTVSCKLEIKAQNEREKVEITDDTSASPKKDITVEPTLKGLAYTVTQDGAFCPLNGTGEKTGGEHSSAEALTVTGQSTTEPAEKINIEVAD